MRAYEFCGWRATFIALIILDLKSKKFVFPSDIWIKDVLGHNGLTPVLVESLVHFKFAHVSWHSVNDDCGVVPTLHHDIRIVKALEAVGA